jgi:tetratricopeptide (TPR) repeat protein
MLMVLAEVTADSLPNESPTAQAKEALSILERARDLRPQSTRSIHLQRAGCLEKAGDAEEAKRELASAENTQPDGAFDHFLSGLERYKRGLLKQARQHFDAALRAQPSHFWAQCLLAICDLNTRPPRPAEAKIHLTACLQHHEDLAWLYLLRGFASGELGAAAANQAEALAHFDDAEADYRAALEHDPSGKFRYALLANRGLVRFRRRQVDLAVADLKEAIALEPRHIHAYVTLAQISREQHQLELALEQLTKAIALEPDLAPLYRTRARWNLERPDPSPAVRAAALADLKTAIEHGSPGSRELAQDHAQRARLLLFDKQFEQAVQACDLALRINPDDSDVQRSRVTALVELKRYDEAIAACDACLRGNSQSADLLALRGLAKSKRNDFGGAIGDYTLALARRPLDSVLHARRGWAYLVSGAPQLARHDFEEAIRLDPSSADAYSGRGSAAVALGRYHEAVTDADLALDHGESDARILYSGARIFAQAAEAVAKESRAHGQRDVTEIHRYQDRALTLLAGALERTPPAVRTAFWRDVVCTDHAFTGIRRLARFARLAAVHAQPGS